MTGTLVTIFLAYISSNLDDIFVLTLLFAQTQVIKDVRSIYFGQLFGILSLLGVSQLVVWLFDNFQMAHLNWLGCIPVVLGIIEIWHQKNLNQNTPRVVNSALSLFTVLLITVSNGADNLGIYIPMLTTFTKFENILTVIIFAVMTLVWCFIGQRLSSLPAINKTLKQYSSKIVPIVYIGLGLYIFLGA